MNARVLSVCALLAIPTFALGQTGYSVTGGLSNFDVHNHCDHECDEFEIEIEGIRPEDVIHTYRNGNYGSPLVVLSTDGTFTIIDYRRPLHTTPVSGIEHFGISLRGLAAANPIRVKWMRNGSPATVNGHIPGPGGSTSPATQPLMPSITGEVQTFAGSLGQDGCILSVTNNDPVQPIWIKRRASIMTGAVTLEALMPNDPVITTAVPLDAAPFMLAPGATVTLTSDLIEVEDNQSIIFAAEYYQDLFTGGLFNSYHQIGPALGNVMTATIASPQAACELNVPIIIEQPTSTNAAEGHSVDLRVNADGNDMTLTYAWLKEGRTITNGGLYSGATTDNLSIDEVNPTTEGFYAVRVTNACGTTLSDSALIYITGHNIVPAPLGITATPAAQSVVIGDTALLTASGALVPPGTTYQWKHAGIALTEGAAGASTGGGTVTGATGPADGTPILLSIDNFQPSDAGIYTVTFTSSGGSAGSNQVTLNIGAPASCSPADLAGGGTDGRSPDGIVDGSDFVAFINSFSAGDVSIDPLADVAGGGTNGDQPDGIIDGSDFIAFINAFAAGC